MKDEDTGEDIECPWCGAVGNCQHRVALIDLTFGQCDGGYAFEHWGRAREIVEERIRRILMKEGEVGKPRQWRGPVRALLEFAREDFDPEGEWISFDGVAFARLMVEVLEEAGGEAYPGSIVDDGGPGSSSAMALLHAENPEKVLEAAIKELQSHVGC